MSAVRVIVFGSRTWTNVHLMQVTLVTLLQHIPVGELLIVHGACYPQKNELGTRPLQSADYLAELWAQANGVATEPNPALWASLGKRAGPLRNEDMCQRGAALAIGFRDIGESRGTDGMQLLCKQYSIPGHMVKLEQWQ